MASPLSSVLLAGHSFVKRVPSDLQCKFDLCPALDFHLIRTEPVSFHGAVGLTVPRLARNYCFFFLTNLLPGLLFLRLGQMISVLTLPRL